MLMRRVFVVGSCVFALATASCAAIFGFGRLSEGPLEEPDGASMTDATLTVDAGPDPRCTGTGYLARPSLEAGGDHEVIGALRRLDFGIAVAGGAPTPGGYNLDRTCTSSIATSSCAFDAGSPVPTDLANGIDNAGFSLFTTLSRYSTTFDTNTINQGILEGRYGAVIRIQEWNGLPDDDAVFVEVFPALGVVNSGSDDGGVAFDSNDNWGIDARFRLYPASEYSMNFTSKAYVAGGQLVAPFDRVLKLGVLLSQDPKPLDAVLSDAVITGQLVTDDDAGSSFLAGGIIAGRWNTASFLDQVRRIYVRNGNDIVRSTVCDEADAGRKLYDVVKTFTCAGLDVHTDQTGDNQGLPCDAISVAAKIDGYRVNAKGTWMTYPSYDDRCIDSGIPAGDDCPR